MGAFWGGFAGTMKDQLIEARDRALDSAETDKREASRREWATSERALDRKERRDDNNTELKLKDMTNMDFISKVLLPDGTTSYTTTVREIGDDGKIQINTSQVTDQAMIARYEKKQEADKLAAAGDALDLESKQNRVALDKFNLRVAPEEHSAKMKSYAERGRGRGGSDDDYVPEAAYIQAGKAKDRLTEMSEVVTQMRSPSGGGSSNRDAKALDRTEAMAQSSYKALLEGVISYEEFNKRMDVLGNDYSDKIKGQPKKLKDYIANDRVKKAAAEAAKQ